MTRGSPPLPPSTLANAPPAIIAGAQNMSFSVPMHSVEWVATQILQHGRVRRGYFGMAGAARPLSREMQRKLRVGEGRRAYEGLGFDWRAGL